MTNTFLEINNKVNYEFFLTVVYNFTCCTEPKQFYDYNNDSLSLIGCK